MPFFKGTTLREFPGGIYRDSVVLIHTHLRSAQRFFRGCRVRNSLEISEEHWGDLDATHRTRRLLPSLDDQTLAWCVLPPLACLFFTEILPLQGD